MRGSAQAQGTPGLQFFEPFMYLLPDGALFATLRTNGTLYTSRSEDAGKPGPRR